MDHEFNGFSAATFESSHLPNVDLAAEAEGEGELVVRDHEGRVLLDLSTLPPNALVRVNDKNCVRTAGLEYFSRHNTKFSKVWDHGFQVLELRTKKLFWVCTKCKLFPKPLSSYRRPPYYLLPSSDAV